MKVQPNDTKRLCAMDMLKLSSILGLLLFAFPTYTSAIAYNCPTGCHCATVDMQTLDQVQLVCEVPTILNTTNFAAIQDDMTTMLTIICEPTFISVLSPRPFHHLVYLEELRLYGCAIEYLPQPLLKGLVRLKHFDVTSSAGQLVIEPGLLKGKDHLQSMVLNGQITRFAEGELCNAIKLEHLDLSGNRFGKEENLGLTALQSNSTCLPSLKSMNIGHSLLQSLEMKLFDIAPSLTTLNLQSNHIETVGQSVFHGLSQLENLDLTSNQLSVLPPKGFKDMASLRTLNLSRNSIRELDWDAFGGTVNLVELDLSHNLLNTSSTDARILRMCTKLEIINLGFNQIMSLPTKFFKYNIKLQQLHLQGNEIFQISQRAFASNLLLTHLNLSHNEIQYTWDSSLIGLTNLQVLDVSYNKLFNTSELFLLPVADLKTLYLNNNHLTRVPQSINNLGHLNLLDLSDNMIDTLVSEHYTGLNSLQYLILQGNHISSLPNHAFEKMPRLQLVNLNANQIHLIQYGTFRDTPNLMFLSLKNNYIDDISVVFRWLPNLKLLWLAGNQITSVSGDDLPNQLQNIDLSHNLINTIEGFAFSKLLALTHVDLSFNRIRKLDHIALRIGIRATKPQFQLFPNPLQCDCPHTYLKRINEDSQYPDIIDHDNLQCTVYDGRNRFIKELAEDDFICAYTHDCDGASCLCCHDDDFPCNCRTMCPANCTCIQNLSKTRNSVNCAAQDLASVPKVIPPSTTSFDLTRNNLRHLTAGSFLNMKYLKALYLNDSKIDTIAVGTFSDLSSLTRLYLNNNHLRSLPPGTFMGLTKLEELYLNSNFLDYIESTVFNSLTNLTVLHLHDNKFKTINLTEFMSNSDSRELSLHGNPWNCDCLSGPFLQQQFVEISHQLVNASIIPCKSIENDLIPDNMTLSNKKREVPVLRADFDQCANASETRTIYLSQLGRNHKIAIITITILIVLIIVTVSLVIHYRSFIQVWLFAKYGIRLIKESENPNKRFDAFISYSQKDEDVVVHDLMPKLEAGSTPYRLCVHFRDWPVGYSISNSVVESVSDSSRTIILLSDNFIKSEWCNYEFQAAHHKVLKDMTRHLIVVLLDDEPPQNLDQDLQMYISTHTYLKYNDPWFWQKLKYALPKISLEEAEERRREPTYETRLLDRQREIMQAKNLTFSSVC